jgi:hypothetical protein
LPRNCLLKNINKRKGRIKVRGRRRRKRKQLLDNIKENRGYCKLKEEALDHTVWRTGFGRGYGPVLRHTNEGINEDITKQQLH